MDDQPIPEQPTDNRTASVVADVVSKMASLDYEISRTALLPYYGEGVLTPEDAEALRAHLAENADQVMAIIGLGAKQESERMRRRNLKKRRGSK